MADDLAISDNKDESRYEATLGGVVAGVVEYQLDGDVIVFTHTGVPSEYEGRGIASHLARYVLDDARSRGLDVLPRCPYISGWIARHLDYLDLVPQASRVRYKLPAEA